MICHDLYLLFCLIYFFKTISLKHFFKIKDYLKMPFFFKVHNKKTFGPIINEVINNMVPV